MHPSFPLPSFLEVVKLSSSQSLLELSCIVSPVCLSYLPFFLGASFSLIPPPALLSLPSFDNLAVAGKLEALMTWGFPEAVKMSCG